MYLHISAQRENILPEILEATDLNWYDSSQLHTAAVRRRLSEFVADFSVPGMAGFLDSPASWLSRLWTLGAMGHQLAQ